MECGRSWLVPPDPGTLRASYCMECCADGDETVADMRADACRRRARRAPSRSPWRRWLGMWGDIGDAVSDAMEGH